MANPLSSDEILARADKALGLQAMVTVLQFALWAYRSQKWLCKAMQEVVSICAVIKPINATSHIVLQNHFSLQKALHL